MSTILSNITLKEAIIDDYMAQDVSLPEDTLGYPFLHGLLLDVHSPINTDIDTYKLLHYTSVLNNKLVHYKADYLIANIYLFIKLLRYNIKDISKLYMNTLDNIYTKIITINLYRQYINEPYILPSKKTPKVKHMSHTLRSILRTKYGK